MPLPYTYFVKTSTILAAPSDTGTGDWGRDPLGAALTGGIFTFSTLNVDRNSTGNAFTGGTDDVVAGDYIYLTFGTGTSVDGLYEIASVTDADNIVLVADDGLIDDSTSVTSAEGPWLTLQYAFDTMATTGSQLVICDDGQGTTVSNHWEYTVELTLDTNAGGVDSLTYRGGNSRGVVDGTVATLSGAQHSGTPAIVSVTQSRLIHMDLRFTAGSANGYSNDSSTGASNWTFIRCRFDNNTDNGLVQRAGGGILIDCELDSNGAWGYRPRNTAQDRTGLQSLSRCRIHDNTSGGLHLNPVSQGTMDECLVYDNGGDGVVVHRGSGTMFTGCVFFGNTGDGISNGTSTWSTNGTDLSARNCIFRSNTGSGISWSYSKVWTEIANCCFHNNLAPTAGTGLLLDSDDLPLRWPGETQTNIDEDPLFVSETDGSEDFTLQATSPCIDAGIEVPTA